MQKHLDLFRALVAFIILGNVASRSVQMPVQTQQRRLGGPGLGLGGPQNLGGGFGGGAGEGGQGLFDENPLENPSRGPRISPGRSLGVGGSGRQSDILSRGGPGDGSFGSGSGGGLGSIGQGAGGASGRSPGSLGAGGFPGELASGGGSRGDLGFGAGSSGGGGPFTGGVGPGGRVGPGGGVGSGGVGPGGRGGTGGSPGLQGGLRPTPGTLDSIGSGFGASGPTEGGSLSPGGNFPGQSGTGTGAPGGFGGTRGPVGLPGLQGELQPPLTGNAENALGGFSQGSFGTGPSGPGLRGSGPGAGAGAGFPPASLPGEPSVSGTGPPSAGIPGQEGFLPPSLAGGAGPGNGGGSLYGPNGQPSGASGTSGSGGPGAPGLTTSGTQGAGAVSGGPSTGRSGPGRGRPGKPRKALSSADAAAIGLGLGAGLLSLGALGAGIASILQQKQHQKNALGKPGFGSTTHPKPPCPNAPRRERRSIPASKVPLEVLNSIPMNFERLY